MSINSKTMLKRKEEFASHLRRLHITRASRKKETSQKDHWSISVCVKLGLSGRTIRGTPGNNREVLYVVPLRSGFLFLLERSLVTAREAVRRHTVQRCFCACHGTCFLISIPETDRRSFFSLEIFEYLERKDCSSENIQEE